MNTKVYFLGGTSPTGFRSKFIEQIKSRDTIPTYLKVVPALASQHL